MDLFAVTDKGITRHNNQDAYYTYFDDENHIALLVVCDGMGGANAGNIASERTIEIFSAEVKKNLNPSCTKTECEQILSDALRITNEHIYNTSVSQKEYSGMGTTLVVALIRDDFTIIMNVGDSRAYLINAYGILQISRDHSVVEDLIARGDITREESKTHPNKNLITRAVGTSSSIEWDVYSPELQEGDYLLLCTDGLTNQVDDQEILYEILNGSSLEHSSKRLIDLTKMRGAPDNLTVALFQK